MKDVGYVHNNCIVECIKIKIVKTSRCWSIWTKVDANDQVFSEALAWTSERVVVHYSSTSRDTCPFARDERYLKIVHDHMSPNDTCYVFMIKCTSARRKDESNMNHVKSIVLSMCTQTLSLKEMISRHKYNEMSFLITRVQSVMDDLEILCVSSCHHVQINREADGKRSVVLHDFS